jgi:hypothetical protein
MLARFYPQIGGPQGETGGTAWGRLSARRLRERTTVFFREGERMPTRLWVAAAAGLLLAAPAWGQHAVSFGGADPTQIVNQPIAIPGTGLPIAQPQTLGATSFSLANYLPSISMPSASSIFGRSSYPTAANMPGKDYLKYFGFQKAVPVQP